MRLIVECEHVADRADPQDWCGIDWCNYQHSITDPDAILAALADAGVLEVEEGLVIGNRGCLGVRYVSPWKETK
jgi:hypothetical protein